MKTYSLQSHYKRENYFKAVKQHEFSVYYMYFTMWYEKFGYSVDDRMNMRLAIVHNDSQIKSRVYSLWLEKTKEKLNEMRRLDKAKWFNERNLKLNVLNSWKRFVGECKLEVNYELKAEKHDFKRLCEPSFKHWRIVSRENTNNAK